MTMTQPTWTQADQAAGYSLPAPFFYDQGVFEEEKSKIFFKSWHLVGHVNDWAAPGTIVTETIFDQSVIVARGSDGEIRAFHNACQHRGNRLVNQRRSHAATVTCGYHAWSYGLDGRLRGAPNTASLCNFDKAAHNLKPVRCETLGSFVFVNLDAGAQPLAEMAPDAEAEMRRFIPDLDNLVLIEEVDVPVAANWKVIQENSIEGYHFDYSGPEHKELVALIDFAGYRLTAHGNWWTYIGPPNTGTTQAYGLPLEGATWQTEWFFNLGLWPNATIYAFPYSDMVGTFIMIPTGPETSLLRFGYYGPAGRALPEVTKACIRWMNEKLGPEDIALNISNQKGLRSLGFEKGRYLIGDGIENRGEHLVRHFHQLGYGALR